MKDSYQTYKLRYARSDFITGLFFWQLITINADRNNRNDINFKDLSIMRITLYLQVLLLRIIYSQSVFVS